MKISKVGPDDIPIELWKVMDDMWITYGLQIYSTEFGTMERCLIIEKIVC